MTDSVYLTLNISRFLPKLSKLKRAAAFSDYYTDEIDYRFFGQMEDGTC